MRFFELRYGHFFDTVIFRFLGFSSTVTLFFFILCRREVLSKKCTHIVSKKCTTAVKIQLNPVNVTPLNIHIHLSTSTVPPYYSSSPTYERVYQLTSHLTFQKNRTWFRVCYKPMLKECFEHIEQSKKNKSLVKPQTKMFEIQKNARNMHKLQDGTWNTSYNCYKVIKLHCNKYRSFYETTRS